MKVKVTKLDKRYLSILQSLALKWIQIVLFLR